MTTVKLGYTRVYCAGGIHGGGMGHAVLLGYTCVYCGGCTYRGYLFQYVPSCIKVVLLISLDSISARACEC